MFREKLYFAVSAALLIAVAAAVVFAIVWVTGGSTGPQ